MRDPESTSAIGEGVYMRLAAMAIPELAADGPVPVDPDLADAMGAFEETALTEEDALDSLMDGEQPDFEAASIEGGAHG